MSVPAESDSELITFFKFTRISQTDYILFQGNWGLCYGNQVQALFSVGNGRMVLAGFVQELRFSIILQNFLGLIEANP